MCVCVCVCGACGHSQHVPEFVRMDVSGQVCVGEYG